MLALLSNSLVRVPRRDGWDRAYRHHLFREKTGFKGQDKLAFISSLESYSLIACRLGRKKSGNPQEIAFLKG